MMQFMQKFMQPKVLGQFRHLLSTFGPLLAVNGTVSDAVWQVMVGIIMAVIAYLWSWFSPEKKP